MKKQINPTIKAHLIRGALYLLLLVAVCAIPFALAQRNTLKQRTAAKSYTAVDKAKLLAARLAARAKTGAPASLVGATQPCSASLRAPRRSFPMTFGVFRGCHVCRQRPTVAALSDRGPLACFVA